MRKFLPLLVIIAGCTGTQGETYLGRPGSPAWFATAAPETIADYFIRRCQSYGFRMGTLEMAQCVQSEAGATRNRNAVRMAVAAASMPAPARHCTSTRTGSIVSTTCY